ncbi:MAG: aromatic acid decarboxylase, partial [Thermoplasmatales archaeon]
SQIHLRNLLTLSEAGAYIIPASPGLYHGAKSIEDMLSFVTSRVLDILGIKNDLIKRWGD